MKIMLIALAALLAGCAGTLPADPVKMTPEQLQAWARDKSVTATCVLASTPWGPQRTVQVNVDQRAIAAGVISTTPDCQVTIQADPRPAARMLGAP